MRIQPVLALLLAACQTPPADSGGFGGSPEPTTAAASTGTTSASASDPGTTPGTGEPGDDSAAAMTEPTRDVGSMPDFGDGSPPGCKGKIDLLFVIANGPGTQYMQTQLTAAIPQFIATIQDKFADFDYHIMVVDGDEEWGHSACTAVCPFLDCKVGDPCCPWDMAELTGEPCCPVADYPCDQFDLLNVCDTTYGAGVVFPAGTSASNERCPIDDYSRYLVKGQTDLDETFACIATVGTSGWGFVGQAMTAAVQPAMNSLGGCNYGFLRDDALLMVTFVSYMLDEPGDSAGWPAAWAQAVTDAKHGDDESVVMLSIGPHRPEYQAKDRIRMLVEMFPFHHLELQSVADYGPAFLAATALVETACAGFVPPS